MRSYESIAFDEVQQWKKEMLKKPSVINNLSKKTQDKFNSVIPDKFHNIITEAIKNMVKAVLIGSEYTTTKPITYASLSYRENLIIDRIEFYKKAATISGASTGAGGLVTGLADFPILISIKIKLLFDIANLYGYDVSNYTERLFILHVFQIAFCSDKRRVELFNVIDNWNDYVKELPVSKDEFDWRKFQQEYRDYIDLAKLLQIVPVIGAFVGAVANYKLLEKLGETAINAYRLRYFKINDILE